MNIQDFLDRFNSLKDLDKVTVTCDHPCHPDDINKERTISKQAAKRNILKNGGECFICRDCYMKFNNPMNKTDENRQTKDIIIVECPTCLKVREMKKECYYGPMSEPYFQICGSCAQAGKVITEEQKEKIRNTLKTRYEKITSKEN
jgi:hypothetical protein